MSDIVILHDSFDTVGGAEQVAIAMAKIFNVPIYTSTKTTDFYDNNVEIIPLSNQRTNSYGIEELRRAMLFKKLKLEEDIILSSGNKVKFYNPQNEQKHINYTYTPTRMFYDLKQVYQQSFCFPKSLLFELFGSYWRWSIKRALNNIDELLCISEVVRDRIRKYWNIESKIIYPPVDTSKYKCAASEGYFLYISRLSRIKRTDIVLDTFDKINDKLVVAGADEEGFEERMKKMNNVDYRGVISEDNKIDLLAHCEGVIYPPMEEDFGIVPIEEFASGKPVIGVYEGFTKYQINNKAGIFVLPTVGWIERAIDTLKKSNWNSTEIRKHALKYDVSVFEKNLKNIVGEIK
jgi:glycosyltransferase involved in cell wall biosynthesis